MITRKTVLEEMKGNALLRAKNHAEVKATAAFWLFIGYPMILLILADLAILLG